jgi:hypothetical protein
MSLSIGKGDSSTTRGGPVTHEGKEVVRWNATRHGIHSHAPVVPGVEKTEDWENHRDGILRSLQPEGHLEEILAKGWHYSRGGLTASPATRPKP